MAGGSPDEALARAAAAGRPSDFTWIVAVGGVTCFLTAFAIGANDVANTFSSSVGSRALPLWMAICLAAVLETLGATLLGGAVTDSIRSKIIDFEVFNGTPTILMSGMLCALIGAGGWLFLANKFGLPVSTTHAIVGALLGFGLASGNVHAVRWSQVASVVLSWLLAPVVASCVGGSLFAILRAAILRKPNSLQRAKRGLWLLLWLVTLTFSVFLVFKNYFEVDCTCMQRLPNNSLVLQRPCRISRWADAHVGLATALALGLSVVLAAIITWLVYRFAAARLAVYRYRHTAAVSKAEAAAAAAGGSSAGGGRRGGAGGGKPALSGSALAGPPLRLRPAAAAQVDNDRVAAECPADKGTPPPAAAAGWTSSTATAAAAGDRGDGGGETQPPWGSCDGFLPARQQQQHSGTRAVCTGSICLPSTSPVAAAATTRLGTSCSSPLPPEDTPPVAATTVYAASGAAAASVNHSQLLAARTVTLAGKAAAAAEDSNKMRLHSFASGRHQVLGRPAKQASTTRGRPAASVRMRAAAASSNSEREATASVEAEGAPADKKSNSRRRGPPYALLAESRRRSSSKATTAANSLIRRASSRVGEARCGRPGKLSSSSLGARIRATSGEATEPDPSTAAASNESRLRQSVPSPPESRLTLSRRSSNEASEVEAVGAPGGGLREQQHLGAATVPPVTAAAAKTRVDVVAAARAARVLRAARRSHHHASSEAAAACGRGGACSDKLTAGAVEACCFVREQQHQCVPQQQQEVQHTEEDEGEEEQAYGEEGQQQQEDGEEGSECASVMVVVEQQHGQAPDLERREDETLEEGEEEALQEAAAATPSGEERGGIGGGGNTSSYTQNEGSSGVGGEKGGREQLNQTPTEGRQGSRLHCALHAGAAAALDAAAPAGGAHEEEEAEAAEARTEGHQATATAVPPVAAAVTAACCRRNFRAPPAAAASGAAATAADAAAAAARSGGGGSKGVGFGCAGSAARGLRLQSEARILRPASTVNGEFDEEDEGCSTPRDRPLSGWQKRLHTRWRTMPWFKDLHAEGQTEDELVARLQNGAEVFETETEIFFSACQVVSACMGCIAHSANDTANAIGPFAAILAIYQTGAAASHVESPWYVLLFGGLSMSLGLALLGYKVIKTVGVKLVKITPARGFAMDLGAAWTVLVFSALGIPLSTTHCAVGSTVGVGLMEPRQQQRQVDEVEPQHLQLSQQQKQEQKERSKHRPVKVLLGKTPLLSCGCLNVSSVNWKLFGGVFVSWIVTILLSGLVSASLFSFAAYSPRLLQ